MIADLLADTWWFGLTKRLPEQDFKALAGLRAEQGFSAIQLVVGVPPEVGPENENARSEVGFPWTLEGDFNSAYLNLAQKRIKYLNNLGFAVIVYGAWGHQIAWLGKERMAHWWLQLVEKLDALDVIYCLCGESNLWIGQESRLLPDKSTGDLGVLPILSTRIGHRLRAAGEYFRRWSTRHLFEQRRQDWSWVLSQVARRAQNPIIIHPVPGETGFQAVTHPHLLATNTVQTGHDENTRNQLWQLPLYARRHDDPFKGFINLEPWYEGIRNRFWAQDQLYAYWVSMLAGATSYCYGAHGVWNVGDGRFLAHWGKQTLPQAITLETPRLIGLSHQQYLSQRPGGGKTIIETQGKELISIGVNSGKKLLQFFPNVARARALPAGNVWLPLEGTFADRVPRRGPVVIFFRMDKK